MTTQAITDTDLERRTELTVRDTDSGLRVASGGIAYRFLATGAETNGRYSLFEATLRPGEGAPFHVHSREEEGFFVLTGEVVFYTERDRIAAAAGTFVNASIGDVRGFRNEADVVARMLILEAPSGLEEMFLEDGTVLEGPDAQGPEGGTECPLVAGKYGISVMPYPLPEASH
ncbi:MULTISPECIES: cupin domain-containing protein [unclassified Mycolicibacterium]|uniref:cupin domain-containing protein n=1 Tax=unclassified Mycolicibacterium TaxID=2636767 RepID=UPI0012DDE2A9|nr:MULTISPECIES: cupin domain-containing protein [unclassified Mycolicibacterium]MUL80694.1 cupin domain-containing protein [Mycolicibacterium sp. CBMA 329]MUL86461.1 cupin domain-containing protein [Mycolicibacterium sp. CBMA 331]MUM01323.1 cupin domain-containing protein [Mycolicibacterium sp. CBMA 334]MUM25833.1 cupin domain-containing protein [Mycolicibacterium sp. CBMA 295]MUM36757.1 cupin domain-containing protein [Mycolicibacterium sp. CBMA 247]